MQTDKEKREANLKHFLDTIPAYSPSWTTEECHKIFNEIAERFAFVNYPDLDAEKRFEERRKELGYIKQ